MLTIERRAESDARPDVASLMDVAARWCSHGRVPLARSRAPSDRSSCGLSAALGVCSSRRSRMVCSMPESPQCRSPSPASSSSHSGTISGSLCSRALTSSPLREPSNSQSLHASRSRSRCRWRRAAAWGFSTHLLASLLAPTNRSSIAVSVGPRATALVRTWAAAPLCAAPFVKPSTACLLAAYTEAPASGSHLRTTVKA